MDFSTDPLSPLGRQILKLDAGRAYEKLTVTGLGRLEAKHLLDDVAPEQLFPDPKAMPGRDKARCVLSALWLWHDWLDECHTICQAVHTAEGSFWHAVMHRREGDFSNSKYWYAKCAGHPVLAAIAANAADVLHKQPADKQLLRLTFSGTWNPNAFVDLVESVHEAPETDPKRQAAVALQQIEWRLLFDYCCRP